MDNITFSFVRDSWAYKCVSTHGKEIVNNWLIGEYAGVDSSQVWVEQLCPQTKEVDSLDVTIPFYSWRKWVPESFSDLSKVTRIVDVSARNKTQVYISFFITA